MKKVITILLLLSTYANAQVINKAELLKLRKERFLSIIEESGSNKTGEDYANILQGLAVVYAELNQKDSALYYLNKSISCSSSNSKEIEEAWNPNILSFYQFKNWHNDPAWQSLETRLIKAFERKFTTIKNRQLSYEILYRAGKYQSLRQYDLDLGLDQNLMKEMHRVDSSNAAFIKQVVHNFGYPGRSLVGEMAAAVAFEFIHLAINDLTFQKEVLEKMKQLPEGEIDKEHVANLTDQISIKEKGRQVYGTQFKDYQRRLLFPIIDSANVDARRKSIGMSSLSEYIKSIESF